MKNFTTLIKESFEIYKQKTRLILGLAVILLVLEIIVILCFGYLAVIAIAGENEAESSSNIIYLLRGLGIISLTIVCSIFIAFSFLILTVKPVGTKLKEIFQETWQKFGQYLLWVVSLAGSFIILISANSFFIIPGIIVAIFLGIYSYALVAEGQKGMNALKRSWNLLKGNWWKVFGRIILLIFIFGAISFILDDLANLFFTPVFPIIAYLYALLMHFCMFCYVMPFSMIFMYLIYLELKKSKEIQAQPQV